MALQPIDHFCETLDPHVKKAITAASVGSTNAQKAILERDYPGDRTEHLRSLANEIKGGDLAGNLEKAVASLERNGITVLFAKDGDEARNIIYNIIKEREAKNVVKIKSMTTEEIELNHFLQEKGMDVVETDLGELIIQIENEKPSHIVKPAIHRTRGDIAESFVKHNIAEKYDDNPNHLTLAARKYLREKYFAADVVVSGANYVLAEEGAIVLCTNEGNSRFSMAGAKTHIALVGFEKVIPSAKELAVFLNLLARSATGQTSTAYTDFVAGPGKSKNSPKEMFLVFLDNGRSDILASESAEILKCIRCGACMNRCPVFRLVGGHAYRATYPGPLGIVLSPLLAGDKLATLADLPKACSLCGACGEVCPAKIPLPDLILKNRDKVKKQHIHVPNDINFWPFKLLATTPWMWKSAMAMSKVANFLPLSWIKFGPAGRWFKSRTIPRINGGNFRNWFKKNG